ncbi:MAG: saccharopine dehydrogenase NADP-binding domain-containing protein [Kofleriaceae bacterium]
MPPKRIRPFDVVLFGASGFTGTLVAHHLAEHGGRLRWAVAGRDAAKLDALVAELPIADPMHRPAVLVADALRREDMARLAGEARVICSTAGPFARYGSELVAACAAAGTDYCDITGEVHWVREMIDAHHETARQTGARLVHCCGFDSIPSDLGTWALQQEMIARHGVPATAVTAYYEQLKGAVSGGTVASMLAFAEAARADRSLARRVAAPYTLNPDPAYRGADRGDVRAIAYDRTRKVFTMPFIMANTNARVVRRSHALAGFPWGADFTYTEVASSPGTARGLVRAVTATGGLAAAVLVASSPRLRQLVQRRIPKPGEGPSKEARDAGAFRVRLTGSRGEARVEYVVSDNADPGYGSTSKMLGQATLCLAFDPLPSEGGCLTPSVAMGAALLSRLRKVGLRFAPAD